LLGTDNVVRDVMSRVSWSTRVSLVAGFASVAIAAAGGVCSVCWRVTPADALTGS
jgi:ABC-type dipeptide/oligopeptide/nickel transport system permease subunit